MQGWVKIYRKLTDNPLWLCEPFTRGQAWVDLILLANHKANFFFKRGVKVNVARGQVGISEVGFADRWQWSRNKVRKFLSDLEAEQQIIQHKSNVTQVITIVNYEEYQKKEQQAQQQLDQQKDSKRTASEQQKDTNKNDKNDKKDKNAKKEDIAKIQAEFYASLKQYVDDFGKETIKEFFDYWSEPNKSRTKIKWQLEKTWDTHKRLQRWTKNDFKYRRKTNGHETNNRPASAAEHINDRI